jgi:hypothetical protein
MYFCQKSRLEGYDHKFEIDIINQLCVPNWNLGLVQYFALALGTSLGGFCYVGSKRVDALPRDPDRVQ